MSTDYPENAKAAIDEVNVLLSFLFNIGEVNTGQVYTTIRIVAKTPDEAVKKCREALRKESAENKVSYEKTVSNDAEYIANFYSPDAVSKEDLVKRETEIYDVMQKEEALKGAYDRNVS